MAWNMFSRFGSDSDAVGFGDLAEAAATNAWTVVDVREPREFVTGHIPNALNIPMSVFDPTRLPHGKPVVLISQSGERSRNALSRARAIGRDDVRHFAGGMNACGLDDPVHGERTAGTLQFKLELDQRESRTVGYCLLACRSRLIETIGDTTRPAISRKIGSRELRLVESVLRKLLAVEMQQKLPSGAGLNRLGVKPARFGDIEPCPRMFDDLFLRLDRFADPPVNDH